MLDGRIASATLVSIAGVLNANIETLVQFSLICAIIISCISVEILANIIIKKIEKKEVVYKIPIYIISYVTIFNFMFLENFYFSESMIMAISVLAYLLAAKTLVEHEKGYLYKSILLVIIGVFCYQGTINLFITMTFVLSLLKHNKLNKQVIKNMIICGLLCGGAVALNLLQIKIIENVFDIKQVRIKGLDTIIRNIMYIFIKIPDIIINTKSLFPRYIFIIFVLVLLFFSYLYYIRKNQKEIYVVGNIILICIVSCFSCFIIHILSLSSFAAGRLTFSIGALIGILFMYMFLKMPILESKKMQYIFYILLVVYFLINTVNYVQKINLEMATNKEDIQIVNKIDKCIQEYEENTGYTIKNIAFSTDSNCEKEKQTSSNSVMGSSAIYQDWSRVGLINYWTNRNLKEIKMNKEIYNKYFKEKDWNEFNEEQCVFIEDNLYYCIY